MSFEPASPLSIITCESCQGQGCQVCGQHGIYALRDGQPIAFALPGFIDIKLRKKLKKILLIKRTTLLVIAASIILFSLNFLL